MDEQYRAGFLAALNLLHSDIVAAEPPPETELPYPESEGWHVGRRRCRDLAELRLLEHEGSAVPESSEQEATPV